MKKQKNYDSSIWAHFFPARPETSRKRKQNRMRNHVSYEWDIETLEGEDVVDHHHSDKLDFLELPRATPDKNGQHEVLVLVREVSNDDEGLLYRSWAYVESEKLPDTFDNGAKVPKRLHAEYERWLKKLKAKQND